MRRRYERFTPEVDGVKKYSVIVHGYREGELVKHFNTMAERTAWIFEQVRVEAKK